MNRAYWDAVAENYEREVLSVFDHDAAGMVRTRIVAAGAAQPGGRAADLGCGVGKFTPLLADAFAHVVACDRSERGLAVARAGCAAHSNVSFSCFDLACDTPPFAPVEFALCVNVLIMPDLDERLRAWRAVTNLVAHGGTLLLVVPSLESVQLGYLSAVEETLDAGHSCSEAVRRTATEDACPVDLRLGVHALDGVRTKHYLREELEQLLPAHECGVAEIVKLRYAEAGPLAWDWLAVARRRGPR